MDKYDQILSAKAWIIMNFRTGSYMRGSNIEARREIASLTKMYTLYACLQINKQLNITPSKIFINIIEICKNGTSAELQAEKYISLWDLYHGMMLPSGNDAAALLSFYYGYWLDKGVAFTNMTFSKIIRIDLKDKSKHLNLYVKMFMQYINQKIIKTELNHKNTKLQNPHGLSNKFQVSTVWQLAQAAIHFMKTSKEFRQIVKTKKYTGYYIIKKQQQIVQVAQHFFSWENTNSLLKETGFEGVKTGHTQTAGSCLATYKSVSIKDRLEYQFLVVVLGCSTLDRRFQETKILCDDLEKYLKQISY